MISATVTNLIDKALEQATVNGQAYVSPIRKGYTKTHTVKIGHKQFITFEAYKALLVGKLNKTWCNTVDRILDVYKDNYGIINYKVEDIASGEVRSHGTRIDPKEVF